jgi:hypothetical protein
MRGLLTEERVRDATDFQEADLYLRPIVAGTAHSPKLPIGAGGEPPGTRRMTAAGLERELAVPARRSRSCVQRVRRLQD